MKTMKMFATTTLLIAGILINQAFAQNAQNATTKEQKSPKTEVKKINNDAASVNQKAAETKAASAQTPSAKPATQATPAGRKTIKPEATAMNTKDSPKHHRIHKMHKNNSGTANMKKGEPAKTAMPVEKPKTH
jgi:hypothetical protein